MLEQFGVSELVSQMKAKKLSPVEVTDYFLKRIEDHNDKINAFVTLNEKAGEEAKKAEERLMKEENVGDFHGIPIAIKDLTLTNGIRTTFGSPAFQNYIPDRDAVIVERLKRAGAIVIGKTNTPEFGHIGTTDNLLFGATKNPWNASKTSGGSSGGSAAAVGAGLVPIAEGNDGGGSIRIPASFCGVYGFKPTYGAIPNTNSTANAFGSTAPFANHGVLSHSPLDAALFLENTQGPSTRDPFSLPVYNKEISQKLKGDLKGVRIAYTENLGLYEVDKEVAHIVESTLSKWEELGCTVEKIDMDFGMNLERFITFFTSMWYSSAAAGSGPLLNENPEWVTDSYKAMIEEGTKLNAVQYKNLDPIRTSIWNRMQDFFDSYDLILSPTLAVPAFDYRLLGPDKINGKKISSVSDWLLTHLYNTTGFPAASLPIGFSASGLPIGLQIAGNRFQDELVLRASYAYDEEYSKQKRFPF